MWYGLIPPITAILLALTTRRLVLGLSISVAIGGLLTSVPSHPLSVGAWGKGIGRTIQYGVEALSDTTNLQILAFVTLILITIAVISAAGGLQGIVAKLSAVAKGYVSTQISVVFLGLVLFIDDYAKYDASGPFDEEVDRSLSHQSGKAGLSRRCHECTGRRPCRHQYLDWL